jgi:multidrug resistance protein MdtO
MQQVWHDVVDPFPGRLAQTWRIALVCALTTMVTAVYGIPEAALSCFLVFFVMKPDAAEGSILALALVILMSIVVVSLIFLTRWTIDVPALRLLAIVIVSLVLLYLGSASALGELGGIIALIVFFVLGFLGYIPLAEITTRAILYVELMAVTPMACVLVVNLVAGIKPVALLRATVEERLNSCAEWIESPTPHKRAKLTELVWGTEQEESLKRLQMTRLLAVGRRAELRRLARALRESYRLSLLALAIPYGVDSAARIQMAANIRRAAQALGKGEAAPLPEALSTGALQVTKDIQRALEDLSGTPQKYAVDGPADPFMRTDALTNPEHIRYAVKTTIAAMICYFIYTAAQWQGIHTAMITCYVAALGSLADTTHKLVLRITGCLIGAALGIGSILYIMPHITSVGAIMVLVFIGTFVSAWVWVGNQRVSYAGVQIALAFLLTVLQGFGPTLDMDTARDRIAGVLLGNCVLYVVFTRLWAISAVTRIRENIQQSMEFLVEVGRSLKPGVAEDDARDLRLSYVSKIAARVAEFRRLAKVIDFEPARKRPTDIELYQMTRMASVVRGLTSDWVRQPPVNDEGAERVSSMAKACAAALDRRAKTSMPKKAVIAKAELERIFERDSQALKSLRSEY